MMIDNPFEKILCFDLFDKQNIRICHPQVHKKLQSSEKLVQDF